MKYLKYLKYIIIHKWFVFIGCLKIGIGNSFFVPLLYKGIIHDWSKLRPSEFFPYVNYFYGDKGKENSENAKDGYKSGSNYKFDMAWLLHQKRNKHHWQWWILPLDDGTGKFLDIPDIYLFEMVADWYGAGRAITGREYVSPWYMYNKEKIQMSTRSRNVLETIIKNFDAKTLKNTG